MSLFVASLNSGSNGNCYYIGNDEEGVLIDVGISCREVEKRLKRLDIPISKIKAVFVTHEHGDHIHGVPASQKSINFRFILHPEQFSTETSGMKFNLNLSIPFSRIKR